MPDGQAGLAEEELIQQCKLGNLDSFQTLYNLFKDRVFATSIRMLGNAQEAEDAAQDIFIKVFRHINTFRGESSLATWIYRIVINTCHNRLKKLRNRDVEDLSVDDNQNILIDTSNKKSSAIQLIIEQEIVQLPSRYRSVFVLHEIEGFTHEEIAGMLNIPAGTSKSQLSVAKSILRKKLIPVLEVLKDAL